MIKKNDEAGGIKTFKKFSDIENGKVGKEDESAKIVENGEKLPANPNLPTKSTKTPKGMSTRSLKPLADKQDYDKDESPSSVKLDDAAEVNETNQVKLYGKVAKMPKGTKASKGFNFLENVKISKNSIWYLMIERQGNELQMVKYNYKKGVDLSKFISDLKSYYISKYSKNENIVKLIESIEIDGNDKYSWIKNIPLVEVDGKKMVSRITEDLIKLLSR
jgi:hypothetical protein